MLVCGVFTKQQAKRGTADSGLLPKLALKYQCARDRGPWAEILQQCVLLGDGGRQAVIAHWGRCRQACVETRKSATHTYVIKHHC